MPLRRSLLLVALTLLLLPTPAQAAGVVQPLWDITTPSGGPFPSDIFTTADPTQLTGRSVDLPKPDCATRPSDCEDVDVLNDLDGFNVQPRISLPFSGEINPATATSDSIFLVRLPDGAVTGINQVVWDPAVDTLHVESDQLLDQHTRYLLVVTRKLLDAEGSPVATGMRRIHPLGPWFANRQYFRDLDLALLTKLPAGVARSDVVAASLFTTQSVTALLEKVRNQIKAATPTPASFLLGPGGSRTVFSLADVTSVVFTRQVRTAATPTLPMFTSSPLPTPALSLYPNSVGTIAFGAYDSPDYETAAKVIPAVGSATGTPGSPGREPDPVQPVPAGRDRSGRRLASRHLRARVHRQHARDPVRRRLVDGPPRDRHGRDQRRRPRWRRARHAHRVAHVGCIGHPRCRRPRHRPERRRRDRLDRGQSAPHRRTRSSRAATGCARP